MMGLPWSRWVMVSWVTLRCNCVKTEQYPYSERGLLQTSATVTINLLIAGHPELWQGKSCDPATIPLSFAISSQIFLAHKCLRKLRPCQWCHCVLEKFEGNLPTAYQFKQFQTSEKRVEFCGGNCRHMPSNPPQLFPAKFSRNVFTMRLLAYSIDLQFRVYLVAFLVPSYHNANFFCC